jgi:hypothetical protein
MHSILTVFYAYEIFILPLLAFFAVVAITEYFQDVNQ